MVLDVRKKLPMEQEELAAKKGLSSTADGEGRPQRDSAGGISACAGPRWALLPSVSPSGSP